jgi:two-component system chemotaxis sensor kinase CheA
MDDRLLTEFLAEAEDLIEELYGDIAALRERRGQGPARRELVGRIFRHIHTIKGTASAAGLDDASSLAHEFESLLDSVRAGHAPLDDEVLEACEEAVGAVAEALAAAARSESRPAPPGLVGRLRWLAAPAAGVLAPSLPEADAAELLPAEVARALSAHERQRLRESVGEGACAYVVLVEFDLANFDEQYRLLSESLGEVGEVVSTQPFVNDVGPDRVGFRIVYASMEGRVQLEERAARFGATLSTAGGESVAGESDAGARDGATFGATFEAAASQSPSAGPTAGGVRVPLEELDDLISKTHELFADTVGALDLALAVGTAGGARGERDDGARKELDMGGRTEFDVGARAGLKDDARVELEARAHGVRRRFFELEERLIGLRMVSLRVTLLRAVRAGRSVARAAGKRVEFEVAGGEARLDRALADRVADPLLHLVRNAVDHGVESEEERRAAGKPDMGRVRVEASTEGGLVVLRVSDDGRGVDAALVARAAAVAGLVAPGARVTQEQALRLIFRPGFSTAERASLVSGRGVGLDVVERAVEEAGGEVRVRSERGRGTTFEMRLPTTLALLPAHIVRSAGQRYCIGAGAVIGTGHADCAAVTDEGARRILRWRGLELPLVEMRDLLGRPASEEGRGTGARFAFVVARGRQGVEGAAEGRAAVAVDGLEGQSEVLVRGLGRHATRWRGVSGATELRDGTIAIVLDLPRLLEALG